MIKFFRNIRQNLIKENRTARYLKYAIGEILLVVVGILVALQINNWNEQKKLRQLETVYLNRLMNDLDHDLTNIDNVNESIGQHQAIIKRFIRAMNSTQEKDSLQITLTTFFEKGWIMFEFVPSKNTYIDLAQTGNMKVINNTELVNEIISYYGYMSQIEESNNINKDWITPIDQVVAKETPAFQVDPSTRDLFTTGKRTEAVTKLMQHKDLLERDAAGHYWINQSLYDNLIAIKGLTENLKRAIQEDLIR